MNDEMTLPAGEMIPVDGELPEGGCAFEITRRDFLKTSAVVGGSAFLLASLPPRP